MVWVLIPHPADRVPTCSVSAHGHQKGPVLSCFLAGPVAVAPMSEPPVLTSLSGVQESLVLRPSGVPPIRHHRRGGIVSWASLPWPWLAASF